MTQVRCCVWLLLATSVATVVVCAWLFFPRRVAHSNQQAVATAEDEVYEAVIHDLVQLPNERPSAGQLVFSNTVDTFFVPV